MTKLESEFFKTGWEVEAFEDIIREPLFKETNIDEKSYEYEKSHEEKYLYPW